MVLPQEINRTSVVGFLTTRWWFDHFDATLVDDLCDSMFQVCQKIGHGRKVGMPQMMSRDRTVGVLKRLSHVCAAHNAFIRTHIPADRLVVFPLTDDSQSVREVGAFVGCDEERIAAGLILWDLKGRQGARRPQARRRSRRI